MTNVNLKTEHSWKANREFVLPYVGVIKFDENACIEVSNVNAQLLMEYSNEFHLDQKDSLGIDLGEDIQKKSEEDELNGDSGEDIQPQVEYVNTDDLKEALNKMSVKEIKEEYLSSFSEEETKDLKRKEQYIDFIISKLVDVNA